MSHFTVLIIGSDPESQLEPFEESPEEGSPYLEFEDNEDEYRAKYETETTTKIKMPDGRLLSRYDDEFRVKDRKPGEDSHKIPEGLEEVEVSIKEDYATFDEYMRKCQGYTQNDAGRYGYFHNPNAKWDWYTLGGRWTGFFKVKTVKLLTTDKVFDAFNGYTAAEMENFTKMYQDDTDEFILLTSKFCKEKGQELYNKVKQLAEEIEVQYYPHDIGAPGVFGNKAEKGWADTLEKRYIDFEGMRQDAYNEAIVYYEKIEALCEGSIPKIEKTWEELLEDMSIPDIKDKRDIYHSQESIKKFREFMQKGDIHFIDLELYQCSKEQYAEKAKDNAISTFAVLKDGIWYEKGSMGWWGIISDEKDQNAWNKQFNELIDSLPEDTILSIYDCHI